MPCCRTGSCKGCVCVQAGIPAQTAYLASWDLVRTAHPGASVFNSRQPCRLPLTLSRACAIIASRPLGTYFACFNTMTFVIDVLTSTASGKTPSLSEHAQRLERCLPRAFQLSFVYWAEERKGRQTRSVRVVLPVIWCFHVTEELEN